MNKATLCGMSALVFWSFIALIVVNTGDVPAFFLGCISFFLGGLLVGGAEWRRAGTLQPLHVLPLHVYLFGMIGIGVYTLLYYMAFKMIAPFIANSLNYLWPVLLTLFLALAQKRQLKIREIIGLALGFGGMAVLFAGRFGGGLDMLADQPVMGYVCAVAAAVIWAGYSTLAKKITYPSGATAVFFLLSAVLALVMHLLTEDMAGWPTGSEWIFILLLGVGRISYTLWDYAMKSGDQGLLASLSYLVPLASTVILILAGYMPASTLVFLGGAMIIAGCITINAAALAQAARKSRKGQGVV